MRYTPDTIHDEVEDDILAEVVVVLERKPDHALDVCDTYLSAVVSLSPGDAHTIEAGFLTHSTGALIILTASGQPCARCRARVSNAVAV